MTAPSVAAVVVHWRHPEDTRTCLAALAAQSLPPRALYLVDNHSGQRPDTWPETADPTVTVLPQPGNRGFAEGANAGLRAALASEVEFVYLCNPDAVPDVEAIAQAVAATRDPAVGVVGSLLCRADAPDRIESAGMGIRPRLGRIRQRLAGQPRAAAGTRVRPVAAVSGGACLLRAATLRAVGLFDLAFFYFCEDVDLCHRIREARRQVVLAPRSVAWHQGGRSLGGRQAPERLYYSLRNQLYWLHKRRPHGRDGWSVRDGLVYAWHLAFLWSRSGMDLDAGWRMLHRGWEDFHRQVVGPLPAEPAPPR